MNATAHVFIIVSYFTRGTLYENEAERLIASIASLNLPYEVHCIPTRSDWNLNTRFKAQFLVEMCLKHPSKRILFLDADAVVHSYPTALFDITDDIGVHFLERQGTESTSMKRELLSGTLFLRSTPQAVHLLEKWILFNLEFPETLEQRNLDAALSVTPDIAIHQLPIEYAFIFDIARQIAPNARPIVEHMQASRRLRDADRTDAFGFSVRSQIEDIKSQNCGT